MFNLNVIFNYLKRPFNIKKELAFQILGVAIPVIWNLWNLKATLIPVAYLNDSSMHEQMVRVSQTKLASGQFLLTSWFPYLGLGSPHFLHYQSFGAMLLGLVGQIVAPNTAFRWSTYLGISLWPICIFISAKIIGINRYSAVAASIFSPFIVSIPGVGYEQKAYLWIGYGLWSQLVGSWFLPIAVAFIFRGITETKYIPLACLFTMLTAASHFETGYLAFGTIALAIFLSLKNFRARVVNGIVMLVGSILMSLWVILPLLYYKNWTSINEILINTPLEKGYGAHIELNWLITGNMFDANRLPVITVFFGIGVLIALINWKTYIHMRLLVVLFVGFLILSFGPVTLKQIAVIIPGHSDLFFRRFIIGVDLIALYLAGIGLEFLIKTLLKLLNYLKLKVSRFDYEIKILGILNGLFLFLLSIFLVSPMFYQLYQYDKSNSIEISSQYSSQNIDAKTISPIIEYILAHQTGRTYAGLPTNWGTNFLVGQVPVFKYLENEDIQEVGYTLRTASLMTDPEAFFNQNNPSDYILFGIKYLILPTGFEPPISASKVISERNYTLWQTDYGFADIVNTVGTIKLNRHDVGINSVGFLNSDYLQNHLELDVSWNGLNPASPTRSKHGEVGSIIFEKPNLTNGGFKAKIHVYNQSVFMLSASYDPGWTVKVDGRSQPAIMLAPAIVGVKVEPGFHTIAFQYVGFKYYTLLFIVSFVSFVGTIIFIKVKKQSRFLAENKKT
jgi:hypothetical protein